MGKSLYEMAEHFRWSTGKYLSWQSPGIFNTDHWQSSCRNACTGFFWSICFLWIWCRCGQFHKGSGFCVLHLIQAYLPDTPETVIIVGFCKIILGTPGFNIHPFGTVLTIPDLFCPLSDPDLLSYKAGLRSHNIPPLNHSQLKKLSTKLFWLCYFVEYDYGITWSE